MLEFSVGPQGLVSLTFTVSVLGQDKGLYRHSNIARCLREFPRAQPKGIPKGKDLYLTEYPELSPNTDSIYL